MITDAVDPYIYQMTASGVVTPYYTGVQYSGATRIILGPDGNYYFTDATYGEIESLSLSSGLVTPFTNGLLAGAKPAGIAETADGNIWFTDLANGAIGEITTSGAITEYTYTTIPKLANINGTLGMTLGPDGNIWFTASNTADTANYVGELIPTGVPTVNLFQIAYTSPRIVSGPQNSLWFALPSVSEIGEIDTAGNVKAYYSIPDLATNTGPYGLTEGPDGFLWFTATSQMGRLSVGPGGYGGPAVYTVPPVSQGSPPPGRLDTITTGLSGNLWFAEPFAGAIAKATLLSITGSTPIDAVTGQSVPGTLATVSAFDTTTTYSQLTASINWGDGSTQPNGMITGSGSTGFTITGNHAYSAVGTYPVSIQVSYLNQPTTVGEDIVTAVTDVVVSAGPTTVSLESNWSTVASSLPAVYGQAVTFTATVSTPQPVSNPPTGYIAFLQGTNIIALSKLSNGNGNEVATFTTNTLALGSHSITADYLGDDNFLLSNSGPTTVQIDQASSNMIVVSSQNPSTFNETVTFTATVSATVPSTGMPTGTVTFYDGTAPLQQDVALQNGLATYTTAALAVGTHAITAVYSGDGNFQVSTSLAVDQIVETLILAPTVVSVVINPGEGAPGSNTYLGNSRVLSIQVTFGTAVNTTALQSAFMLTRVGLPNGVAGDNATIGDIGVATSINGSGETVATLTFSGANTEAGSLADGNWTLSIPAADVVSNGIQMAGNFSQPGIKRLFGDIDGSGLVDSADLGIFGTTFGLISTSPSFIEGFDYDGNGVIDSVDLSALGTRFGLTI